MHDPLVSIQVVVRNGERYLRNCLDSVAQQSYRHLEVIVLDNASDDATHDIVTREYPQFRSVRSESNLGMWPGQEYLLSLSTGAYVCSLSVDVILDPEFIAQTVQVLEADPRIGAVQGKLYQYAIGDTEVRGRGVLDRTRIDTCGFAIARTRKIINIGHGLADGPEYSVAGDIFGVEGAVPVFRRSSLERCRIEGVIWDADYFWYGDDSDVAWRMTLFGIRQRFVPSAVAWHDRSTTKGSARVPIIGQLRRLSARRTIPLHKRRLGWSNDRFTIVKNDYIINILRDIPYILAREIAVLGYTLLFEPAVLLETGRFFRLLPRMLRRRGLILQRAVASPSAIHQWFQ